MSELNRVVKGLECCHDLCGVDLCRYCPYGGDISKYHCQSKLMTDALELLKEKEPKVLTLEQAKAYAANEKDYYGQKPPIYVEYYRPRDYWVRWLTMELLRGWLSDDRITDYNKANPMGYRFWTYYPTDKQRKAVEWDG